MTRKKRTQRRATAGRAPTGSGEAANGAAVEDRIGPPKRPEWTHTTYEAIETWRRKRRLSKVEAAKHLGVAPTTLYNWRSGETVPLPSVQARIASLIADREEKGELAPGESLQTNLQGVEPTPPSVTTIIRRLPTSDAPAPERAPATDEQAIRIGQVLARILERNPNLDPSVIPGLVRGIREALE